MKKLVIVFMALFMLGFLGSSLPISSELFVQYAEAAKTKKHSKKSKKASSTLCQDNKCRLKRLKQLGINQPKNYLNYGKDLSLNEMGKIIGAWIVDFWKRNGRLPDTLTNNPPSWLMLNLNGTCVSGPCKRWAE